MVRPHIQPGGRALGITKLLSPQSPQNLVPPLHALMGPRGVSLAQAPWGTGPRIRRGGHSAMRCFSSTCEREDYWAGGLCRKGSRFGGPPSEVLIQRGVCVFNKRPTLEILKPMGNPLEAPWPDGQQRKTRRTSEV